MERQPWIDGSLEVFELSIEQFRMSLNSEADRDSMRYARACLINGDDAVELSIRGYIEFSCGQKSQSFFENLKWLASCNTIDKVALKKIEGKIRYYHLQRDTLYHQGYTLNISRLNLLDYLSNVSALFKLLFPIELENALQYNSQGAFLIQYIELEKMVVNLCEQKGPKPNEDFEMSELSELLAKNNVIDENTKQSLNEIADFANKLIPVSRYEELGSEAYEVAQRVADCIRTLKAAFR